MIVCGGEELTPLECPLMTASSTSGVGQVEDVLLS